MPQKKKKKKKKKEEEEEGEGEKKKKRGKKPIRPKGHRSNVRWEFGGARGRPQKGQDDTSLPELPEIAILSYLCELSGFHWRVDLDWASDL